MCVLPKLKVADSSPTRTLFLCLIFPSYFPLLVKKLSPFGWWWCFTNLFSPLIFPSLSNTFPIRVMMMLYQLIFPSYFPFLVKHFPHSGDDDALPTYFPLFLVKHSGDDDALPTYFPLSLSNTFPIRVMMMLYQLWPAHELFMNTQSLSLLIQVLHRQLHFNYTIHYLIFILSHKSTYRWVHNIDSSPPTWPAPGRRRLSAWRTECRTDWCEPPEPQGTCSVEYTPVSYMPGKQNISGRSR